MKNVLPYLCFAVLATTAAAVAQPNTATDSMSNVDCSQAEAMLEDAVKTKDPAMLTGNVDKDFATVMMLHEKISARINHIEAKCGKDPHMQAKAEKDESSAQQQMSELRDLGATQ